MTYFWIIALLSCAFALVLVFWPWVQRRQLEAAAGKLSNEERIRANVRIHKERLRELASEKNAGRISDEQFDALKQELEDNLLADAEINAAAELSQSNRSTLIGLTFTSLLIVVGTAFLYTKWGAYDQVEQHVNSRFSDAELASAQAMAEAGDARGLLLQLRDKLRNSPNNIEGWSLLASSSMNAQMFDIAIEAYDQLILIEQEPKAKAALYGLKAQALYFNGSALNSEQVRRASANAFEINKDETNTLGLLAIASFEARDFEAAIKYWKRILDVFPEHPSKDSIRLGIESAQRAIGAGEQTTLRAQQDGDEQQIDKQVGGDGGISVVLSIAPDVVKSLSGKEQVVIFAKAQQGPPMPLAVARYSPSELPEAIVLNDRLAMMPELKISSFELVDLTARITSGGVERQSGDYEVTVRGVAVGQTSPTPLIMQISGADKILEN
jgi:cytochrome c-type biogenesis protein CcmH